MGLKGLQISGNSIMPVVGFLGAPLVDRFPTHAEQFNQNVNSLGFGSAGLARQSITTFQPLHGRRADGGTQAVDLRTYRRGRYDARELLSPATVPLYEAIRAVLDRPPDPRRSLVWDNEGEPLDDLVDALVDDLGGGGRIIGVLEQFRPLDLSRLGD